MGTREVSVTDPDTLEVTTTNVAYEITPAKVEEKNDAVDNPYTVNHEDDITFSNVLAQRLSQDPTEGFTVASDLTGKKPFDLESLELRIDILSGFFITEEAEQYVTFVIPS